MLYLPPNWVQLTVSGSFVVSGRSYSGWAKRGQGPLAIIGVFSLGGGPVSFLRNKKEMGP